MSLALSRDSDIRKSLARAHALSDPPDTPDTRNQTNTATLKSDWFNYHTMCAI